MVTVTQHLEWLESELVKASGRLTQARRDVSKLKDDLRYYTRELDKERRGRAPINIIHPSDKIGTTEPDDPEIKRFLDQYGARFRVALTKKPADREPEEEAIIATAVDLGLSGR